MAEGESKVEIMIKALAEALILSMVSQALTLKLVGRLVAGHKPSELLRKGADATGEALLAGTLNLMAACLGAKVTEKFATDLLHDMVAKKGAKPGGN